MPTYSNSRRYKLYLQAQSGGLRALNNTAGTWSNTGMVIVPYETCTFTPAAALNTPPFKTGTPSNLAGVKGRSSATFSMSAPLIPSGTAGTAPNLDILLLSIFGTKTVSAGVSVTYSFLAGVVPFAAFLYDKSGGTTPTNMVAFGCHPTKATITFNGNFLMISVDCEAVGIMDSDNFASYTGPDAALKAGITAFPTEPTGVTAAGSTVPGYGGVATFDSGVLGEVVSGLACEITPGYEAVRDNFSDGYTLAFVQNARTMQLSSFTCINSDSTALKDIKQKGFTKATYAASIALGSTAGQTVTLNMAQVQSPQGNFSENGARVDISFNGTTAHASAVALEDDGTLVLT